MVLGAVLGRYAPLPELAWLASLALALLGAVCRPRWSACLAVGLSAMMLGLALGRPQEPTPAIADHGVVQGTVTQSSGRSAVVETPRGSWRLSFYPDPAPAVGTRLSAQTRPSRPAVRLPHAPHPTAADRRAGRRGRRVVRWIELGGEAPSAPLGLGRARHGDVLVALATGRKSGIDPGLRALLQRTGTAHLLAISGLHIGLVAGLVYLVVGSLGTRLLARLARPSAAPWLRALQAVLTVGAAALYAQQVGWPVSTQRAVVMVTGGVLARAVGRAVTPWSLLAAAAIAVVLVDASVVEELGFGLSFGAVMGILAVSPRISRWLPPDLPWPVARGLEGLAVTLGAMAGTLPLTALWFQELSPLSPLANAVVGPIFGTVVVPAALVALHGPALLQPAALWMGDQAVELSLLFLETLDVAPWNPAVGPLGALCLAVAVALRRQAWAAIPLAMVILGARSCPLQHDELQVTFLSVGQGDAVFVRFPDGRRWLVDGGPPSERVLRWLRTEGHTELDAVLLTHPDSDHLGGLEAVIAKLDVGRFVAARPPVGEESAYRRVWRTLAARRIPVALARDGPVTGVPILHPMPGWRSAVGAAAMRRPKDNDDSLVLHLEHGEKGILLTGDIEAVAERWLAPQLPSVEVLQAPHHGSRTSSTAGLVAATDPDWVVISCGQDNRFGHPHAAVLASWRGRQVVRTDRDGTVRVRLSRHGVRVERWVHHWGWVPLSRRPWRPLLPRGLPLHRSGS